MAEEILRQKTRNGKYTVEEIRWECLEDLFCSILEPLKIQVEIFEKHEELHKIHPLTSALIQQLSGRFNHLAEVIDRDLWGVEIAKSDNWMLIKAKIVDEPRLVPLKCPIGKTHGLPEIGLEECLFESLEPLEAAGDLFLQSDHYDSLKWLFESLVSDLRQHLRRLVDIICRDIGEIKIKHGRTGKDIVEATLDGKLFRPEWESSTIVKDERDKKWQDIRFTVEKMIAANTDYFKIGQYVQKTCRAMNCG